MKPFAQGGFPMDSKIGSGSMSLLPVGQQATATTQPWEGRSIATQKLRIVEFSAFMESQRDQDTVSEPEISI